MELTMEQVMAVVEKAFNKEQELCKKKLDASDTHENLIGCTSEYLGAFTMYVNIQKELRKLEEEGRT